MRSTSKTLEKKSIKIVVIIPSRYCSSRFEGKPLAMIAGKPMIQRVCERAKLASNISDVVVATDDKRIFDAVLEFGGKVIITSVENRSGTDRVGEAAEIMGLAMDDVIVNIQGDQPLMEPACLDQLTTPFFYDPKPDISTLAFKIIRKEERTDPKDVKVTFDKNGNALYFSRSPIPYARDVSTVFDMYKHLGFYAYTRSFLEIFRKLPEGQLEHLEKLEQLRVLEHGYGLRVVVTEYDSPEVDLPDDIVRVERILRTQRGLVW